MKMFATSLIVLFSLVSFLRAEGNATNPEYTHWAKFKVGTSCTSKGDMDMGQGQKMTTEFSATLKEVTPNQVKVENAATMIMGDQRMPGPPRTRTIKAEPDAKTTSIVKVGTETVEALGKKIDCTVYQLHVPEAEGTADIKIWVNADIPGAVKMELHIKSDRGEMTQTMLVQSVDVK